MHNILLLWLTVNPNPVCFTLPFFNHDIAWYGCIFSLFFYVGYKIFIWIYARYLLDLVTIPEKYKEKKIPQNFTLDKTRSLLYKFYENRISDKTKRKNLKLYLYLEEKYAKTVPSIYKLASSFADSALLYIIAATIIGARLAHIVFYQNVWEYITHPLMIIKTWEGGLASHGGIAAILVAAYLFTRKRDITFLRFMDLISAPTMFVCAWIRIGNFINQEILGAPTTLPWAIIFQNPADGSAALPRHPIQLYEFLLYLSVSLLLFFVWKKNVYKNIEGLNLGLALAISFTMRFFLEFLKLPQSIYDTNGVTIQVSQLLSIPMAFVGIALCYFSLKRKESLDKKVTEL